MVGSAILRLLIKNNYKNLLTIGKNKLNFLDQNKTYKFLQKNSPDIVIIAAAKVGGIMANNIFRAEFIYQNLQIQNNLIHGSHLAKVKKLIFLGSSCIYPKDSKQPIREDYLLKSSLEYTNEPYAIAKIAGLKMCENYNIQYNNNFLCLMPCNLYGPNDNYDPNSSHFLPALIKKIHDAKVNKKKFVTLWGDGSPKREVMHVDDLADACLYYLKIKTNDNLINIGTGVDHTILYYAKLIMKIVGYSGKIKFDKNKPNGTPRKLLDVSLSKSYGWQHNITLEQGIRDAYNKFLSNKY